MAKSNSSDVRPRTLAEKTFLTAETPVLLALAQHRFKDLSNEAFLFAITQELGLEYSGQGGEEELFSIEFGCFSHLEKNGKAFTATEEVYSGLVGGNMQVLRFQIFVQDEEFFGFAGEVTLRDELRLFVNEKEVVQPLAGSKQALVLEALDSTFYGRDMTSLDNMLPMERIRHILRAFWEIIDYPRDRIGDVWEIGIAVCDRTFQDPVKNPLHIGKCYVHYLIQCLAEERADTHIMSFSNYIKSGRWKRSDIEVTPRINLWSHPGHETAKDIFNTMRTEEDEIRENKSGDIDKKDDPEEGGILVP